MQPWPGVGVGVGVGVRGWGAGEPGQPAVLGGGDGGEEGSVYVRVCTVH